MVSLDFTDPVKDDDIIGWKSDRGWLYLTLLGVRAPKNQIPSATFNGVVRDIVLDDFDESIQIAILVGRPIVGYDIVNSPTEPTTVVFIHTEMRRSELYTLKKHIEKSGSSIFGQVKTSKFPEYNTDFESAFKQARLELGANAIFRYDGKLFTTNHPEEEQEKIKNALRQKPKGYFEIEPAYRSFDGEFYTDVEVEPNQEKTSRTNANKKDPIIKPNGNNNLDLDLLENIKEETEDVLVVGSMEEKNEVVEKIIKKKKLGSIVKSIFSNIIPKRMVKDLLVDSVETSPNLAQDENKYLNEIEILELKIAELENSLIKKENILKEEQRTWENRAEKRQAKYSQDVADLESKLIDLSNALKEKDRIIITDEKEKNKIIEEKEEQYFSRERQLQNRVFDMEKKLKNLEQERSVEQKKWESQTKEKDLQYKASAQNLQMKLLDLESALAEKDLELFDEKTKWEMLSEKKQDKYRKKSLDLESQLIELQKSIQNKGEKIYAERDKWRQLAKERQKKLDDYEPLLQDFNDELKNLRKELLSDLYDQKIVLDKENQSSAKNMRDIVKKAKNRIFPDKNAKQYWIDSVYADLEDDEFAFKEYFSLALPDESESLDEPSFPHGPDRNDEKKWRADLPPTDRDRYKTAAADPIFQYYYNGGIRVETNMAGIPIYINGKLVGNTPLNTPIQVEPGWHQVSGFSPVYNQVANSDGLSYVGNDPIIRNNQLYGAKTIFVESGKVANVSLKFNRMGNVPKKLRELKAGWAAGFPMVLFLFYFITWSL
ncbi:MAG: hypothetical protein CMG74_00360 [Candidatus Marinimicrobia bacterium]|nr:hypothetical protein [Candidatus Neomarinimicrobiota bacterium]|tara:strand:- start:35694 stop:38012 length:2319 start_codon:yes stop_codon:yes gene_type:complete